MCVLALVSCVGIQTISKSSKEMEQSFTQFELICNSINTVQRCNETGQQVAQYTDKHPVTL